MRILALLTDAFGGSGGIAKYNRDFLSALCRYPSCDEVVAIPRLAPNKVQALPDKLNYIPDGLGGKARYAGAVLKTVLGNPKFDLVICGHLHLLWLAQLLRASFIRSPLFLLLYGVDAWKPTRHRLSNYFTRKLDGILSISEVTLERFKGWAHLNGAKSFLLPPAVELDRFSPGEKDEVLLARYGLSGKTVMMSLARLSSEDRYKGIDEALGVMPELVREVPNLVYLVAGDGTDRRRLEEKAKALGLQERVIFTGFVPEEEKARLYRLADVFVMPGRGEGFGIVYLEAVACGVPVVGSKKDASIEALRHGELGVLVDPDDPREIREGILEALRRPRGAVPRGLEFFSHQNFEKRCWGMLEAVSCRRGRVLSAATSPICR
ncbi:MAG: glycosyltransferase family 4 protein [Candidatus Omnitrophica bacterium]|nr:glycosyltransferase family 4 protein [Candidatus Omnitrophota bacterium]